MGRMDEALALDEMTGNVLTGSTVGVLTVQG